MSKTAVTIGMGDEGAPDEGTQQQTEQLQNLDNPDGKPPGVEEDPGTLKTELSLEEQPSGDEGGDEGGEVEWPEWVPAWAQEKYKSPDEFAKAVDSMNSENGRMARELQQLKKGSEGEGDGKPSTDGNMSELIESLSTKYQETGELAPEDRKALTEAGIPEPMIDQYIAGAQALVDNQRRQIFDIAGGEAEYQKALTWASENLTPEQQAEFDADVTGDNFKLAKLAVKSLIADYRQATGTDTQGGDRPRRMMGMSSKAVEGFKSEAEMSDAINDPRYSRDPAYRAEVQNRVARTKF